MDTRDGVVFVDADDTLWENNRYFTAVLDRWSTLMDGLGVARDEATRVLEACEDRNIPLTGYGAAPFVLSLREAFGLLVTDPDAGETDAFDDFASEAERAIRDHPIVLLPGVEDGLRALAAAWPLVVLSKGQQDEQSAKIERSGLLPHFHAVRIVREKDPSVFAHACREFGAPADRCWMVGNSPASDVNPARLAGLRTVLVPHEAPWHRELAPLVEEGPATLVARNFGEVPALVSRP